MQHKVLGTIDFGCSEAPPSQPFSPVACALTLCQHGVLSPFSCGTWQLLMNLALPQSQGPRRNMKVFLPLSHLLSRSELKADGSLHHGAHVPRVRLNSSSRLIYLIWLLYSLVKSVVLLKHTCRRKFNCFFLCFWLPLAGYMQLPRHCSFNNSCCGLYRLTYSCKECKPQKAEDETKEGLLNW